MVRFVYRKNITSVYTVEIANYSQARNKLPYTGTAKVKLIMTIIISRALLVYITTSIECMLMLEDLEHAPQEILKITYSENEFEDILIQFVDPCDISITQINSMLTTMDIWIC